MRPITKGLAPKAYSHYRDAIGDLETCFGRYCSYCERHVQVNLAVEHVSPKKTDPARENDWSNFLIGCTNCNSVKGDKITNDADFLWPDKDNTMLAIDYKAGGIVKVAKDLDDSLVTKATSLIDLVGLDRHPGMPADKQPADRDLRYVDREEAWQMAQMSLKLLAKLNDSETRDYVVASAKKYGFFSIWISAFKDDAETRRLLIEAHAGTARDCFDQNWALQTRTGGQI